jgi:hypothetical protein
MTLRRGFVATVRRLAAADAALALGAAALAEVLACAVLEIWRGRLDVPLAYSWDANYYGMVAKGILDHGWYYRNPNLGAPFGQQLYDHPIVMADNLQALLIKLLGLASSDWATVMNVYFLLGFPLAALTAFFVFRRLGAAPAPSIVCSVLFALLPYHFARGEYHLLYAGYFAVPLGAYLVLAVFGDDRLFARGSRQRGGVLAYASRQSLLTVMCCAVVALASGAGYYAVFTILLVAAGMLLGLLAGRGKRALVSGSIVIVLIAGVLAANLAPALLYMAKHGANPVVGKRGVIDSEIQALKLAQLVLPIEHHRVGELARLSREYAATQTPRNERQQAALKRAPEAESVHLGLVATLGFIFLLAVAIAGAAGRRGWPSDSRYSNAAVATLIAFLIATVGGISVLIAATVSPEFRSWNRLSIFIAFFGLFAVALSLSELGRRWRLTRGRRLAFAAILVVALGVGVLDLTSRADVPDYRAVSASYRSDGVFVRSIERRLGGPGTIFQLPYLPFPEGGSLHRLTDYDLARGFLHSKDLRWSFGSLTSRPQDWQWALAEQPVGIQIRAAAASGFDGVWIDRFGYVDSARSLERQVEALAHASALESPDRRIIFFDLRGLRRRLARAHSPARLAALRRATLYPITVEWLTGFGPVQQQSSHPWRSIGREAQLAVDNPSQRPRTASIDVVLATRRAAPETVLVDYGDGSSSPVRTTRAGAHVRHVLELEPGRNLVRVTLAAPAEIRSSAITPLMQAVVVDEGFWPFESNQARPTSPKR